MFHTVCNMAFFSGHEAVFVYSLNFLAFRRLDTSSQGSVLNAWNPHHRFCFLFKDEPRPPLTRFVSPLCINFPIANLRWEGTGKQIVEDKHLVTFWPPPLAAAELRWPQQEPLPWLHFWTSSKQVCRADRCCTPWAALHSTLKGFWVVPSLGDPDCLHHLLSDP